MDPQPGSSLQQDDATRSIADARVRRVQQLFRSAIENPEGQAELLAQLRASDAPMADELESMLAAHEDSLDEDGGEVLPRMIGPYRLLRVLGEGGMGVVYLAEQVRPIQRQVAVKLIKLGMDTRQVIARFETERQALALMNHPNVARVLDAGSTTRGRPYFVMEYAAGVPITRYCDEQRLTVKHRLSLFITVCHAVQHAHQKGIIHRDIKPSNVLVVLEGGSPVPKVIDFGVAKATDSQLSGATRHTEQGHLIGTPSYMSPEQASLGAVDIDTRADIYALGVLLYELLVGVLPFDPDLLRSAPLAETQRLICEVEPPRPSIRAAGVEHQIAVLRNCDPPTLVRQIRGDLDWMVLRALEKDRTRRYATAAAFGEDITRYLQQEPVLACPPSTRYRLTKFLRRNRNSVMAGLAILIALSAGLASSLKLYFRAERARTAEQRQRERAEANADQARREAAKAEAVNLFLQDMLASPDPWDREGLDVRVVDVLDRAAAEVEARFAAAPEVAAALLHTLGRTYRQLRLYDKAAEPLEQALRLRRENLPEISEELAQSLHEWAALKYYLRDAAQAERLYRQALDIRMRLAERTGNPEDLLRVAETVQHLAATMRQLDQPAQAEKFYRQALTLRHELLPAGHRDIGRSLNNMGFFLRSQGRKDEAEGCFREALGLFQRLHQGPHLEVAGCMRNLANCLSQAGRLPEARMLIQQAMDINRAVWSSDDRSLAASLHEFGGLLMNVGDPWGAEGLLHEALRLRANVLPPGSLETGRTLSALASCLAQTGRRREESALLEQALAISMSALGGNHPETLALLRRLAAAYEGCNDHARADQIRERLAPRSGPDGT